VPIRVGQGEPRLEKRQLTGRGITRREAVAMIAQRAHDAGLPASVCGHTFRARLTVHLLRGSPRDDPGMSEAPRLEPGRFLVWIRDR
jgi:hypothetical protein